MREQMLSYLQGMLTSFKKEADKYGMEDRMVQKKMDSMLACKEMVEAIIEEPVNLGIDGKVTVGF